MNVPIELQHHQTRAEARAETLKQLEPWGRLLLSSLVWIITVSFIAGRATEQQKVMVETVERAKVQFADTATKLNLRIDNLSDQIMRLAISNERLSTQIVDQGKGIDLNTHRIEKLEERR